MWPRRRGDAGQAFPIYITVVGGLLFLALAYLAVGQAAANRNGAQTAADAAALAAALERRDQLAGEWLENLIDPVEWQAIFDGAAPPSDTPCTRAEQLAAQNDADVLICQTLGALEYRAEVRTNRPVGESIVPGTEDKHATATAQAVIEARCTFDLAAAESDLLPQLNCDGDVWELDPEDPEGLLPEPEDLFDVHLAD